ncbi:uncharacterized protein LOC126379503 isoform X2 [Pectinophora gossypiella]|uniref:uncharacterized protein LOC126379503 isoform X2 n=1 Tax=Pectinophora gossypiella TaxID=13191 RepID=UPI00214E7585|nr:uncharacterized protein LOC126379503 isoform X2 [Pectinophora gossypiella]
MPTDKKMTVLVTDGVFTDMPIIKAELRRQPSEGKDAYEFSVEIETDLMKGDAKKEIPSARNKGDETETDAVKTQIEDHVKNKTYIKIGKSKIVVTDTTDEEKHKKTKRKKVIVTKKSKKTKSKSSERDTNDKKRRFKVVKPPDETTNEVEQELFVIKNSEDLPVTHLDKWINEDLPQDSESQSVTESVEVKKKPVKNKSKLKKRKQKPFKLYKIKMAEDPNKPEVQRPFRGYRSTKQGFLQEDLINETSRVLNVVYDANGEPMNHVVIESYSYIPTKRKPLLNLRALNTGEIASTTPNFLQLIRSNAPETVQTQNPGGINNPSLIRYECQSTTSCKTAQPVVLTSLTTASNFNLNSTTISTVNEPTQEVKVNLQNVLNRMAESQMLENITNILLEKLYDKMSTKTLDSDKDENSVEKIEILLDQTDPDNNEGVVNDPNMMRMLSRFKSFNRNKGLFLS